MIVWLGLVGNEYMFSSFSTKLCTGIIKSEKKIFSFVLSIAKHKVLTFEALVDENTIGSRYAHVPLIKMSVLHDGLLFY